MDLSRGLPKYEREDIRGLIDLTLFQFLVRHPAMQNLNQVKQLGGAYFYYPNAVHTRLGHAYGTLYGTLKRALWLFSIGKLTWDEVLALCVAALVHDIGHGPFSHLVELQRGNHEAWGIQIVRNELVEIIEEIGAPIQIVLDILHRTSPLSSLIFGTIDGTDKIDYLYRDPLFVFRQTVSYDALLATNVHFERDVGLYVLPSGYQIALDATFRYWSLYSDVYEHPETRVHQRYWQELLRQMTELDDIVRQQFESGGEDGVVGAINYWSHNNGDHPCTERFQKARQSVHPKATLVYSPYPNATMLNNERGLAKLPCDASLLVKSDKWSVKKLAILEKRLARMLNLAHNQVSITPPPPERRWKVPTTKVECGKGNIVSIGQHFPDLISASQMSMQMARNLIVSVDEPERIRVATDPGAHQAILELLMKG